MAKILLIDDDIQLLKAMTSILEKDHHVVVPAGDGIQGIKLLENQRFDLLITDVIMPEQDGIGLLIWLKSNPNPPKVIAISGGSTAIDQVELLKLCKLLSADRVLPKPITSEALKIAIHEVLNSTDM